MIPAFSEIHVWADSWWDTLFAASWQGAIAVGVVWLVCRIPAGLPPRVQCWLWRLVAVKLLLSLIWIAPVRLAVLPAQKVALAQRAAAIPAAITTEFPYSEATPLNDAPLIARPTHSSTLSPAAPVPWNMIAASLWLAGVVLGLARIGVGYRRTRQLRDGTIAVGEAGILATRDRLCRQMKITSPPEIAIKKGISGPMLIGIIHPIILLPEATICSEDLDMILGHELAHLRRRDLVWGWMTALSGILYFFHPMVYLLRRELRRAEEAACDSQALCVTGRDAGDYGRMLLSLATSQARRFQPPIFAAGIVESAATLRGRLRLLARAGEMSGRAVILSACCVGMIALAGLIPWRLVPKASAADATQPAAMQPLTRPAVTFIKVITGQVIDADGKPALGATVWGTEVARMGDHHVLTASAAVAADGSFTLTPSVPVVQIPRNLDPQVMTVARGTYFASIPGVGLSRGLPMGTVSTGPLPLEPATSLHLTLTNPDGTPAAGVSVHPVAIMPSAPGRRNQASGFTLPDDLMPQWAMKTDAAGKCAINGLPRGFQVVVDVADDRYATLVNLLQVIPLSNDPVSTASIVLSPASKITGTVVYGDGNKPAAAMTLRYIAGNARDERQTVTDVAGHYTFNKLAPGPYTIYLDMPSTLDWVAQPVKVTVAEGASQTADLTLIHGGIITGRIRDKASGRGIANINLVCLPDNSQTVAGPDGSYTLRVLPGKKTIQLLLGQGSQYTLPTPGSAAKSTVTIADGETANANFDLTANASPVIKGIVVDAAGKPADGAMVYYKSATPGAGGYGRVRADEQGGFTVRGAGGTILRARFGDLMTAAPTTSGDPRRPVTLQVSAGNIFALAATVTDEQGAPIPGAKVQIVDGDNAGIIINQMVAQAGADGTAHFDEIPTDLNGSIYVSADGYRPLQKLAIPTSPPHQRETMTVALKKADKSISGVVVDENGAPVSDVMVTFTESNGVASTTRTDADGHFSFAVVSDVTGQVFASKSEITLQGGQMIYRTSSFAAHASQTDMKITFASTNR